MRRILLQPHVLPAQMKYTELFTMGTYGLDYRRALAFIIAYVTGCGAHPAAAWESQVSYFQNCLKTSQFEDAYAISDFILDVIVLVLPLPRVSYPFPPRTIGILINV